MKVGVLVKIPSWSLFLSLALMYLILGLLLRGPLEQGLGLSSTGSPAGGRQAAAKKAWAATVDGHPITKTQLDLATDLFLARRGQARADLSRDELRLTRLGVLDDLINGEIFRIRSQAEPVKLPEELLESRVRQFQARFAPGELRKAMQAQDLSAEELQAILREHACLQFWLEEKTRSSWLSREEAAKQWYGLHGKKIQMPELVRARHLFLSSVFGDIDAKAKLVPELARQLREGRATFQQLCPRYSEDERTKNVGGELGYFSRERVPPDFAAVVFAQEPGKPGEPFRTKMGWHIVLVEEKIPARVASWEEVRPEIAVYLENHQRAQSLQELTRNLRALSPLRVEVFGLDGQDVSGTP